MCSGLRSRETSLRRELAMEEMGICVRGILRDPGPFKDSRLRWFHAAAKEGNRSSE